MKRRVAVSLAKVLDAMDRELGPPSKADEAWARRALGREPSIPAR